MAIETKASSIRRPHRKSRLGCLECKRRHVKCDEARPVCGNCAITSRACSFLGQRARLPLPLPPPALTISSPSPPPLYSNSSSSKSSPPPLSYPSPSLSLPSLSFISHLAPSTSTSTSTSTSVPAADLAQLELFHHLSTHSHLPPHSHSYSSPSALAPADVLAAAFDAPYLMNALLAHAAHHLAVLRPARARAYHHHAMQLQTHALGSFNARPVELTRGNLTAVVLFSWLVSVHVLRDALTPSGDSCSGGGGGGATNTTTTSPTFLDRFLEYVTMGRSVATVVRQAWPLVFDAAADDTTTATTPPSSGLAHVFSRGAVFASRQQQQQQQQQQEQEQGQQTNQHPAHTNDIETAALRATIQAAAYELTTEEKNQCLDTVAKLQRIINILVRGNNNDDDTDDDKDGTLMLGLLGMPQLLDAALVRLLMAKNRHMLLVLAYYGAVVHMAPQSWITDGVGGALVGAVLGELAGRGFDHVLAWPRAVIGGSVVASSTG